MAGSAPPSAAAASPAADAAARTSSGSLVVRLEPLILGVVIAAQLLPLLLLPYLPTQDGPSHQALAYALRIYDRPEGASVREYLVRNSEALPNWFVFFLQAKLLGFLPVLLAEKVLVAAYVVLFPLGLRYALRGVAREAGWLAALGLPFTYNFLLGMGFFNFCWSLAAFLFAIGFYFRHRDHFAARHTAGLAALAAWVYLCHPVTLVMLLIAIAVLGGWCALLDARAAGGEPAALTRAFWRAAGARLLLPLVAFLPVLFLLAAFVGRRLDRPSSRLSLWVKAKSLVALYSLVSFDHKTLGLALALSLLLGSLAAALLLSRWRHRGLRSLTAEDGLLAVAVVFALVYFLAPSELAGGGFVNHRLALFAPLVLILWLASGTWSGRVRAVVPVVGGAIALGFLSLLWVRWSVIDRYLREYVATAEVIEDGRTVLPLTFAPAGVTLEGGPLAFRLQPFRHAIGYVAGRRPIVDLGLYEAGEDYFPLRFRPELDPYRHLSIGRLGIEEVPPRVDIPGYERRGGRVDYVLLWQPRAASRDHPATRALFGQLAAGYDRVHVSRLGNAELWRRRRGS